MANEPFIDGGSRPDLTVDLNAKVGDLSVRQLSDILGNSAPQKLKQFAKDGIKDFKEIEKFHKDQPDKFLFKEHKDGKDTADHKANKDHKEAVDGKANKDHKESVDGKGHKDSKDHKDHKEIHKEQFKEKDQIVDKIVVFEQKAISSEVFKNDKELAESGIPVNPGDPAVNPAQGIDQLIQRVSGLEQQVATLQQGAAAAQGGGG